MTDTPIISPPVALDTPVKRGDQEIAEVRVRKPQSGEMRGVNLVDVGNLDVVALIKVLPRVTMPSLTGAEIAALDLADLTAIGSELTSFLLPKAKRPASLDE